MALDFPVGTDFPANGDQIPDGHEYEGFYWDSSAGVWKRLCERDKIGNCLNDDIDETVCDRLDALQQDIIELEEEIDAIAPSVEYGTWRWLNAINPERGPEPGTFFMLNTNNPTSPSITDQYGNTDRLVIHNDEYIPAGSSDPVDTHTWKDATPGKLIQLYDAADPDFLLGRITAKNDGGGFVYIDIERIQTSGQPNNYPDLATGDYLTRINIFEEPSGGDASDFVKKIGDTMTGDLEIDRSDGSSDVEASLVLTGKRPNKTNSTATIKFENKNNSSYPGYLTYRSYGSSASDNFFKFNRNLELNNNDLKGVRHIKMNAGGTIQSDGSQRILVRGPSQNSAATEIKRPGDNLRTFSIKGKKEGSNTVEDIFWVYGNSYPTGDAILYTGLITKENHIVNKKYVDGKVGGPYVNSSGGTITITKSGSNYYIS